MNRKLGETGQAVEVLARSPNSGIHAMKLVDRKRVEGTKITIGRRVHYRKTGRVVFECLAPMLDKQHQRIKTTRIEAPQDAD